MTTWNKQIETSLPFDTTLLLTDGKNRLVGRVERNETPWFPERPVFFSVQPEGISGYEWEPKFEYENITHWAECPELPTA